MQKPEEAELAYLNKSKTLIGFFWPGQNEDALKAAKKTGTTSYRHGYGATYFPCPENGCVILNGEYRRLPRSY